MAILAQDNFDTDTAGQIAPGWVALTGTWTVNTVRPVSGANAYGIATVTSGGERTIYTGAGAIADMDVAYVQKQVTATNPIMGTLLRCDSSYTNAYVILYTGITGTSIDVQIYARNSGTLTKIKDQVISVAQAAGDVMYVRATIVGSLISVYVGNGSLPTTAQVTVTDTSVTPAGYPGLFNANDGQTFAPQIDNYVLNGTAAADTTPPTFVSASVSNATPTVIQVTMSEALAASVPANSAWSATGSTTGTRAPTSGTISGSAESLTFGTAFVSGETITLSYTAPGANPRLQDLAATPNITASFGPVSVTNSIASNNNALINNTANVLVSPGGWNVGASDITTVNCGSDFSTLVDSTTCTLLFDTSTLVNPPPQARYRFDRYGAWTKFNIAASVTLTVPTDTSPYVGKGGHLLEVEVKSMTSNSGRYSAQGVYVKLTGILLDVGKTITAPTVGNDPAMGFGDSIADGTLTVNGNLSADVDRNDGATTWIKETLRLLGYRAGPIGFGSSSFNGTTGDGVPIFPAWCTNVYSGVPRVFPANLKLILIAMGTNDSADVTTNATNALNNLLAATTNSGCKIIVIRPLNSSNGNAGNGNAHASQLQAAIAACSTPARCAYLSTEGFFTMANSFDGLHPYGIENVSHIAPQVANSVRALLSSAPTLTARTVTLTLGLDANTPAANLTGLKVSFFDEASPDLHSVARYKTAAGTTNASGVCSFTIQSTLAAGGTGYAVVQGANGLHYNGPAVVA